MSIFGIKKSFGVNYAAVKVENVFSNLKNTIDGWDPEGSSEAEIRGIDQQLSELTLEAGQVEQKVVKEKADVVRVRNDYNRRVGGLGVLQTQLDATTDAALKAEIEKVMEEELTTLAEVEAQLAVEEQEEEEAVAELAQISDLCKIVADKLKTARKTVEQGKAAAEKAERREQLAAEKEARAKKIAGITKDMGAVTGALNAYTKKAEKANASAASMEMKAKLLTPVATSNLMEEAMKAADAGVTSPKMSIADRMAALKKK